MNEQRLTMLTQAFKGVRIAVCGDFFLDRYLWIDPTRAELSVETGLVAHQVTHQTSAPGAAGTVAANLAALGAHVVCLGVVGDDGDGYTLRQGLQALGVDENLMILTPDRPTATYTKPVIRQPDNTVVERERLDIRSREPLPTRYTMQLAEHLETLAPRVDGIVFADQMPEHGSGVVDAHIHAAIERIAAAYPQLAMYADSRQRIGLFRDVVIKPNLHEARAALRGDTAVPSDNEVLVGILAEHTRRPVVMTLGPAGVLVFENGATTHISGVPVDCPIDIVGAGDSVMAALAVSTAAGATLVEAAEIAMLVAAVTIRKLGTTGTATPAEILDIANRYDRLDD
jgi:rfaE bifunctional protein kinase chain/domain